VVNKINLLRKSLLRYQYLNNGIKSKKVAFFDFGITTWKTMNKWQKKDCFTTSVPVDPYFCAFCAFLRPLNLLLFCAFAPLRELFILFCFFF